jgi:hypothetical protein
MKHYLIFLISLILLVSCESNTSVNPTAEQMKGSVIGYVSYFDTLYTDFNDGNSHSLVGAEISVEGTTFKAITDVNGRWEIHDLPAGTYTISCSKENYTTLKSTAFKFVGNGTDLLMFSPLGKMPFLTPTELVTRAFEPYKIPAFKDTIYVYANGDTLTIKKQIDSVLAPGSKTTFTAGIEQRRYWGNVASQMTLFFASDSNISPEDPSSYRFMLEGVPDAYSAPANRHDFTFTTDTLKSLGLRSGQELYCVVYATSVHGSYCGYYDLKTGRTCWTGYRPVRIVKKFILP